MDGWRVDELRMLPLELLDRLALIFNEVERNGRWPQTLGRGLVSLISKGCGARPEDMRPISVMSAVYRLWAAARLLDVNAWQEQTHMPEHQQWQIRET